MGTSDRPLGATTTSGPAHDVDVAVVSASTRRRSPTPPTARSSRPAATTTSGWWTAAGLAVALRVGQAGARRSGSARAAPGCAAGSAGSSRCPTTSRCSTSAGTRPTPTPAGPGAGCRPRPSGRRPPPGTRRPHASGASRGATRRPTDRARQPRPAPLPARPGRLVPGRRLADGVQQMIGDVWEWTSTDVHRLPGLPVVPLQGVLRGVLRRRTTGCCAAARWATDPLACRDDVPQLGPPDPAADLRRLPHARDGEALMCRHLA